jgi:hypothetical protein
MFVVVGDPSLAPGAGWKFRNHNGWVGGWKNNVVGRGHYNTTFTPRTGFDEIAWAFPNLHA